MLVVRLIDSEITPKAFLSLAAARSFAESAFKEGAAERAEIYDIRGAIDARDAIAHFNAGNFTFLQAVSRKPTPEEIAALERAEAVRELKALGL